MNPTVVAFVDIMRPNCGVIFKSRNAIVKFHRNLFEKMISKVIQGHENIFE